jgi:hypothetical protein
MKFPPIWPFPHQRRWFQAKDGTFYRNCPLIMQERYQALRWCRFRLASQLREEWAETFRGGVTRKPTLGRNDTFAGEPLSFREAYPDEPGLWMLDAPSATYPPAGKDAAP